MSLGYLRFCLHCIHNPYFGCLHLTFCQLPVTQSQKTVLTSTQPSTFLSLDFPLSEGPLAIFQSSEWFTLFCLSLWTVQNFSAILTKSSVPTVIGLHFTAWKFYSINVPLPHTISANQSWKLFCNKCNTNRKLAILKDLIYHTHSLCSNLWKTDTLPVWFSWCIVPLPHFSYRS